MSFLTFLLAVAAFLLLWWEPTRLRVKAVHWLLYVAIGFLSGVFWLFAMFTLWWPPKDGFAVLWSSIALVILAAVAMRRELD